MAHHNMRFTAAIVLLCLVFMQFGIDSILGIGIAKICMLCIVK